MAGSWEASARAKQQGPDEQPPFSLTEAREEIQPAGSFCFSDGYLGITKFFAGKCPKSSSSNVNKAERRRTQKHHTSEVSSDVHDLHDTEDTIMHEAAWTFLLG